MGKLKVGVVGLGGMGSLHLENLLAEPRVELVGVADVDEAKLAEASRRGIRAYRDYRRLVEDAEAVVIATPPFLHREQAVYALERGVHVFLEKPMGVSLDDAKAIVEAAERTGARLAVGYCLRFHEAYEWIARRLDGLGAPLLLSHWAADNLPVGGWLGDPAKSGGLLNENSVHVLYVFYWFAGPFQAASAALRRAPGSVEEAVVFQGVHESGALSSLAQTWRAPRRARGWLLVFEGGVVRVDGYVTGVARVEYGDGRVEEKRFGDGSMYAREMRDFVEAVLGGRDPLVTGRDGLEVQRAVDMAYRAAGGLL